MADNTGAPWLLPYPEDTDLVRDGASDIEALATAVAAGLTTAGQVVEVKSVLKTDVFTVSATAGTPVNITGLSVTHATASATNRVVLFATVGGGRSGGQLETAFAAAGALIGVGAAAGSRIRTAAVNRAGDDLRQSTNTMVLVHTPGSTASVTYTVVLNPTNTETYFVGRSVDDSDIISRPRNSSTFVLVEIA